jgi:hypothetical protein
MSAKSLRRQSAPLSFDVMRRAMLAAGVIVLQSSWSPASPNSFSCRRAAKVSGGKRKSSKARNARLPSTQMSPDRKRRTKRVGLLEPRLQEIDALAAAGKLTEAVIAAEVLSISPFRKIETDESENIARRLW